MSGNLDNNTTVQLYTFLVTLDNTICYCYSVTCLEARVLFSGSKLFLLLNCFIVTTQHTRLLSWCPDSDCAKAVQRNELFARYTSASSFFSPVGMIFERFILLNASLNNRLIVWLSRKRKVYL